MASVAIVGDGPGGLSAALFLAKNGQDVVVFGDDKTAMHFALLNNYLGLPGVPGSDFQETALAQVGQAGAEVRRTRVTDVSADEETFTVETEDGSTHQTDYLVLSEGRTAPLAESLGLTTTSAGAVAVDQEFRASLPRVYVLGRSIRPKRSQAIISAGAGATAALDILATEAGEDFQDWDSPPED